MGPETIQKGSNINSERLRFDFNSDKKLTEEQVKEVEEYVNSAISAKADVNEEIMLLKDAVSSGAHGTFNDKYGEKVKVYTIKNDEKVFSKEICGGPHIKNTKELGLFRIKKQESVGAGIKRIKAILE